MHRAASSLELDTYQGKVHRRWPMWNTKIDKLILKISTKPSRFVRCEHSAQNVKGPILWSNDYWSFTQIECLPVVGQYQKFVSHIGVHWNVFCKAVKKARKKCDSIFFILWLRIKFISDFYSCVKQSYRSRTKIH